MTDPEAPPLPAGAPERRNGPGLREALVATFAACVVALAMAWPLPARLATHVPYDLGDPLLTTWQTAWLGHALTTHPSGVFQTNIFWPARDTLAYTDSLLGLAPFTIAGHGVRAALVRHGLLWIGAGAVALLGAYLLARELGARAGGAAVAGLAYAYAPFRLSQGGHLHVLWNGPMALALFLLVRGYRRRSAGTVLAGWLVATWQLSISWTIGLPFAYTLAVLGVVAVGAASRRGRLRSSLRPMVVPTALGIAAFLVTGILIARPYFRVTERYPWASRGLGTVEVFSPPAVGFLAAPEESRAWGPVTRPFRDRLKFPPEHAVFPGVASLLLAAAGLAAARGVPRSLRIGLAVAAVAYGVLALGAHSHGPGRFYPYRALLEWAPGFHGLRTPGRLMEFAALPLGLLAGFGADRVTGFGARRGVTVALAAAIALEGLGAPIPTAKVPAQPPGLATAGPGLQIHLPIHPGSPGETLYMVWSVDGFPQLVNGYSGIAPPEAGRFARLFRRFPDELSATAMRTYSVRSVVVHLSRAPGPRRRSWETADYASFGMSARRFGDVIVVSLAAG